MIRLAAFGTSTFLLMSSAAMADDLSIYAEFLGGGSLPTTSQDYDSGSVDDVFDIPAGGVVAIGTGVNTGVAGLSIGLDLLYGSRDYLYDIGDVDTRVTGSIMATAKFSAQVTDMIDAYVGGGLGEVYYADIDNPGETPWSEGWGLGYQLKAGMAVAVTDNVRFIGELRHINSFAPIESTSAGDSDQMATTAILAGISIGM